MEQSVVEWCEAYNDKYTYSPNIAEMFNTMSNMIFILVSLISLYQFQHPLFTKCNRIIMFIGIGSAAFHATDTYIGQLLDEFPMSMLMYYYISIVYYIQQQHYILE